MKNKTEQGVSVHAAHYGRGGGHDLGWINIQADAKPAPPVGYEFHYGFVRDGLQWWSFCKRLPLSNGRCPECAA